MTRERSTCVVRLCGCTDISHEDGCSQETCGNQADSGLLTCLWHRDRLVASAKRLPQLDSDLQTCLAPYRSPQAPKRDGGRSAEAPGPINLTVFETRASIFEWLEIYSSAAVRGNDLTAPGRDVPVMARVVSWHADWLCTNPTQAPTAAAVLQRLVKAAEAVKGRFRTVGLYLGPCPVKTPQETPCGGPVRYDRDQAKADRLYQVECPWCRTRATVTWWVDAMGATTPTLMRAPDLALFLDDTLALELAAGQLIGLKRITSSHIRGWKHTGHITPTACDLRRRDLYNREETETFIRNHYRIPAPAVGKAATP